MEKQKFHVSQSMRYNTLRTLVGHAILFLLYKTQKSIGIFFVLKKTVKFYFVCTVLMNVENDVNAVDFLELFNVDFRS